MSIPTPAPAGRRAGAAAAEPIVAQRICSGEVRLAWNDACAETGVVPDAIVLSDTVHAKPKPAALS